jgi:hypothetical protein
MVPILEQKFTRIENPSHLLGAFTMYKQTSFLTTGAILVAAVVTVAFYNVNVANAQAKHDSPISGVPG